MAEQSTPLNPVKEEYVRQGEHEISLSELLKIILRRKYGILAIVFVSLVLAFVNYKMQIPEYYAESVMMINDTSDKGDLLATIIGTSPEMLGQEVTKKDVELLGSMPIAEMTVRALFNSGRRDSLEFFGNRQYLTPVDRLFHGVSFGSGGSSDASPEGDGRKKTREEIMREYAIDLNGRIRVEPVRETNLIKVAVSSPFPDEAVFLTNTLCQTYKNSDIERNSEKYMQANGFIAEMLRDQKKKVDTVDNSLSQYMQSNEIYEVTGNTAELLKKLVESDAKYNDIQTEYNIAKNSLAFLEKKLSDADKAISAQIAKNVNAQLGSIMDEIKGLESQYMLMLQQKGVGSEEAKAKRRELDAVKTRYEQLSRSKIAGEIGYAGKAQKFSFDMVAEKLQIQRKLNELNFSSREFGRLKQYYESQLTSLPKKQQDYMKLERDREVAGKTYLLLKEKLDETRIMQGSEVGSVVIIGSAFEPFKPEQPVLMKTLLVGLVLGGLFAAMYTFVAEIIDDTIKDQSFFRDIGLVVLSTIPLVNREKKGELARELSGLNRILYNSSKVFREKLLSSGNGENGSKQQPGATDEFPMPKITDSLSSGFAESFRTLRTSLDYSRVESPLKSILVSGTAMSEGKSTVCANLGMAYAMVGKKTLIIDCDIRRASQHKKFGLNREKGLTDYLFGSEHAMDESYFHPTHIENLYVLTAGKKVPNPNELLGSGKMHELITELQERFDKVLIDSPPLFLSDAAQFAHAIDGVLLVSRLHFTSRRPIKEFVEDHFLHPLLLGVTVISSREADRYGYGKYGYGKYGYGRYGYGKYEDAS